MLICPDCTSELSHGPRGGWRCARCGWQSQSRDGVPDMLSSRDRNSALMKTYAQNYTVIAEDDLSESIQSHRYLDIQTKRLFSYAGELRGLSVCEVGVGQGRLFKLIAKEQPAKLTGVDIAMPYLEHYSDTTGDARLVIANAENMPFADEFDVVIASDVLEHVLNVGDALLSMHRALKRGGRLVLRVPYRENLIQYAHLSGDAKYDLAHLRDFNRENLSRLLRGAGFELGGFQLDGFWPERKRAYISRIEPLAKRFDDLMQRRYGQPEEISRMPAWLGRLLMRPSEITAIARKPARSPGS
jgi:SAM-dependent methyltransferase